MQKDFLTITLVASALAFGPGCGESSKPGQTTGGHDTEGPGGMGGNSGDGGTGDTGDTGGTNGTGGTTSSTEDATFKVVHGCSYTTSEDRTADAITTITSAGLTYDPKCVRVRAGSSIRIVSNFTFHPLVAGTVAGTTKTPDPASPIKPKQSGSEATYVLSKPGTYPYYCDAHASQGMIGVVYVE